MTATFDKHAGRSLKTEKTMESVLTPPEAAELLRVSVKTIYRLTSRGEVPSKTVGGQLRFLKSDLVAWLKGDSV